jgi:4-aminobutyrate aminotransferase
VRQVCGDVTLVGGAREYAAFGFPAIEDAFPDRGPLGGIHAALQHSDARFTLIVGCDMPYLTPDFLEFLLRVAPEAAADAVVPESEAFGYEPLLPGVHIVPFPDVYREFAGDEARATRECLAALRELTRTTLPASAIASVLIEPIQGEGGYRPAPAAFLRGLREFCDEHGILLIADEVQCGFGRTGRMWGFEHAGIVPDVVCLAKSIANGLPLSAIVSRRELQERWGRSAHGTTFGGNPVACAAGIAVLETIRAEGLVANAAERGAQLTAGLRALMAADPGIGDVRGPGLMVGTALVRDRTTRAPDGERAERVIQRCADLGLLVLSCGVDHDVVRWIAPLDVTAAEIDEALAIFAEALRSA